MKALLRAAGATGSKADAIADDMQRACDLYAINTPKRLSAFIAQTGHESAGFLHSTEIWGPTPAQARYEGRADLGNTQSGDGPRYRGHGFIQTTGRANHARVRDRLRARLAGPVPDFEAHPELLAQLPWSCLSAADYWDMRGLNALADAGDFAGITRRINGGMNGYADRVARWERVIAALPVPPGPLQPPEPPPPLTEPAKPSTGLLHWLRLLIEFLTRKRN